MVRRYVFPALVLFALATPLAHAGRKPQEFREPAAMTDAEREAAKARSKSNLNQFGEVMENKPAPFPWMAVTLAGLCFLVAVPFAIRAFRRTARELADTNAFGNRARRSGD